MTAAVWAPLRPGRYQLLAGLQVVDVATTYVVLRLFDHAGEGNPLVGLILRVGLGPGLLLLLAVKVWAVWGLARRGTRVRLVSAVYGLVVANNLLALLLYGLGRR